MQDKKDNTSRRCRMTSSQEVSSPIERRVSVRDSVD